MTSSSRIDTVILDLDGTLVDSVYEHVRAWKVAFERVGVEIPAAKIHRAIGMGGDRLVSAVAGENVEHAVGDDVRSLHDELFWSVIGEVRPVHGADDLLRRIQECGREAVLATSSPPDQVDRLLSLIEGSQQLKAVVTGEDVGPSKPAPDIIEVALQRGHGGRAVVVGDATWDIESAHRAGLPGIGVCSGGLCEVELAEAGAVAVFDSVLELAAQLGVLLDELPATEEA